MDQGNGRLNHSLTPALVHNLQSTGEFQTGAMAKPNDLAACQVTVGSDWILAKVIQHDPASGMYKLSDEDVESNKSKYLLYRVILICNYACFYEFFWRYVSFGCFCSC